MRSCAAKYQQTLAPAAQSGGAHLSRFELDVELVVHERLETLVVLVAVLLVLPRLDRAEGCLVREVAANRDMTGVEDDVLAVLKRHLLGNDDDGLASKDASVRNPRKGGRKGRTALRSR